MAQIRRTQRNNKIVRLRDKNKLSYEAIGKLVNLNKKTVWEIWHREKGLLDLSTG